MQILKRAVREPIVPDQRKDDNDEEKAQSKVEWVCYWT